MVDAEPRAGSERMQGLNVESRRTSYGIVDRSVRSLRLAVLIQHFKLADKWKISFDTRNHNVKGL